jgi:thiol-disulfide isomerase/thioredoxin
MCGKMRAGKWRGRLGPVAGVLGWVAVGGLLTAASVTNTPPKPADPVSADQAWDELVRTLPDAKTAAERLAREPSREEQAELERRDGEKAGLAADKARAFQAAFPGDSRVAQARHLEYQLLTLAVELGHSGRKGDLAAFEEARLKDPGVSEDERFEVRMRQTMRPFLRPMSGNKETALSEVEGTTRALHKEFPKRQEVYDILWLLAQAHFERDNAEKCRTLAQEIAQGAGGDLRGNAQALVRRLDRLGRPLKLKFETLEGEDFDLEKLRGKVVLVDFWASGSGPCRAFLPEVQSLYKKHRAKGFQIVGISFDENRPALEKLIADQNITWPQYFDGRGAQNKVGRELDVTGIPSMWLIDRKGNLRDLNARENLSARVEKLLAER